jgi:hypothetical protein
MPAASAPTGSASPVLGVTHPLYQQWRPYWQQLLDVYEGSGGFLDANKPYLVPHPREWLDHSVPVYAEDGQTVLRYDVNTSPTNPSPKLRERRRLARYENIAATLIDQLCHALFREKAQRTFSEDAPAPTDSSPRPIEAFWKNADGLGTSWDALLQQAWKPAGVFGHLIGYLDMDPETDLPVVRLYTPLDVPDWLIDDRGALVSVKLLESKPREGYSRVSATAQRQVRVREVDADKWVLRETNGTVVDQGEHPFGILPVFVLYAKRRAITPFVGKSILGDPQCFIDLYNLVSEVRELLRKQTFSMVNVVIGDSNLETVQKMIGSQSGTGNMLFTPQASDYISGKGENVEVYHEHIDRLVRTIYRLAVLPWESDSRDAEAADSRRIKREDLNQALSAYADECAQVDHRVTELVYRARFGEAWESWYEKDGLAIHWPDSFEVTPLEELVKQFADTIALELGETATKEAKKRAVRAALPNLSQDKLETIDEEIDASEVVTEEQRRQDEMAVAMAKTSKAVSGV